MIIKIKNKYCEKVLKQINLYRDRYRCGGDYHNQPPRHFPLLCIVPPLRSYSPTCCSTKQCATPLRN